MLLRWAAVAIMLMSSAATADSIDSIATWESVRPRPLGYVLFCREHQDWCQDVGQETKIPDAAIPQIDAINRAVNHAITYRPDKPIPVPVKARPGETVMVDTWEVGPEYGDCEDYAVTKLADLLAAGFPRSALRLAIYRLPDGVYHTVLTAEVESGTLVLNNLTDRLQPWREVQADWHAIERASSRGYVSLWTLKGKP